MDRLEDLHRSVRISKQLHRKVEGIELVRLKREQRNQNCFSSWPFVLCGLPVRRLPADQLLYERRNGKFVLQVTGHPNHGVPFGQDRIAPIFLATLVIQQKSQTIQFKSAAEMLETFGMSKGGKEYRRLVAAFERTFGATIFFGTDSLTSNAKVVHRARFNFFSEARIWYNHENEDRLLGEPYENVIVLSNEFFEKVSAHSIPTDLEAVKVFSSAPAVLDLFVWLSYRCFTRKGRNGYRSSGRLDWCNNSAPSNMHGRGNFEKNSINGSKRYGSFGRNALREFYKLLEARLESKCALQKFKVQHRDAA
jgi:hypothetical protein